MSSDDTFRSNGTETAERVADVLLAFASTKSEIGVSALARQVDLSKAVVYRILQSLVSRGLVQFSKETRRYSLGLSSHVLGLRALDQLDVPEIARTFLQDLRDVTGETTTLSLLAGRSRTYIDQYISRHEVKMTVPLGTLIPLHAGSSSRAILAFLTPNEVDAVLRQPLKQITDRTIIDIENLRSALDHVREVGYAQSTGERQNGASSIAAPIFNASRHVIGAVSVCGPQTRFSDEAVGQFVPRLLTAAKKITTQIRADSSAA